MTLTATGNKLRHKNVSYDYITTDVVNALKSVLKIIVEKYLRCRSRCYSEVIVMKNFANFRGSCIKGRIHC